MRTGFFRQIQKIAVCLLLIAVFKVPLAWGDEDPARDTDIPLFSWNLLWTGSFYNSAGTSGGIEGAEDFVSGGTLYNRGDLNLIFPRPDISLRFLATDKRSLPFWEENTKAGFNPAFGVYHGQSGSRLLLGVQSEYGLPARIRSVWLRSVPFMESRSPSSRDLKTEPSVNDSPETYLYLSTQPDLLPLLNIFASTALDKEMNPAFTGGFDIGGESGIFSAEGFYFQNTLAPRKAQRWFSAATPLPERDFRIYAMSAAFNFPSAAFAGDLACSETFSWGRGLYGNFALRLGDKPWRFSFAGDAAGGRFVDRAGGISEEGLRIASKTERFFPRSGLLRFGLNLGSSGLWEDFERGSFSFYFRPSAPGAAERRRSPFLFRLSRFSFGISRDARTPAKIADSLEALLGYRLGFLSGAFSCSFNTFSAYEERSRFPALLGAPLFGTFDSFKISGELGVKLGIFNFGTRVTYNTRARYDPVWGISFNTSVMPGRWGRAGIKIASSDFPKKWNYTFSWRFDNRFL